MDDLEQFFVEQQSRMSLPEEGIDEYINRISTSGSKFRAKAPYLSVTVSGDTVIDLSPPSIAPADPNEKSRLRSRDINYHLSVKRKPSEPWSVPIRRKQSEDRCISQCGTTPSTHAESSLSSEDCFPHDPLSNLAAMASRTRKSSEYLSLERKPILATAHRSKGMLTLPSEPASPILSFSMGSIEGPVSLKNAGTFAIPEKTMLKLLPLNEATTPRHASKIKVGEQAAAACRSNSPDQHPTTSPIEDPSSKSKSHLQNEVPEASELYMKVKKRVAHHTITRRRDKIVKLSSKPTNIMNKRKIAAPQTDKSSIIYMSSSPSSRASSPNPAPQEMSTTQVNKFTAIRNKPKPKVMTGKKAKPQLLTPTEYAQRLNEQVAMSSTNSEKKTYLRFLVGKHIFYTGGDMNYASETTRGRMDLIVRHGGNLVPAYDPSVVTHIITDAQAFPTLRAMRLKHLREIPDHIPTVAWPWMVSAMGHAKVSDKNELEEKMLSDLWIHAAFMDRIEAGPKPSEQNDKIKCIREEETVMSRISTQGVPTQARSTSKHAPGNEDSPKQSDQRARWVRHEDPLAEFYAAARAELYDAVNSFDFQWALDVDNPRPLRPGDGENGFDGEERDEEPAYIGTAPIRGWSCDNKEVQSATVVNQDIIDKLTELMELHKAKVGDEDHWRAFSYHKSIRALRNYPSRVHSYAEARNIPGVGERTARKIEEILETGELRRIRYETTDEVKSTRLFQGIYAVGQSTAFKWYAAGCRTLDDITTGKFGVVLSHAQEIGIRFYDDINDRMPRVEAKAIFELIRPIALSIDPQLFIEIMGSYRRGKVDCGDIDILITRATEDGKTHAGILSRLLKALRGAGIIVEDLALPEDSNDLEAIYRGLCRLPNVMGSKYRRIDFLTVPWRSRGAALLYYTGDDIFNRAMRLKANVLGYSLNQRGLFVNVTRDPKDRRVKVNPGELVASETEEEIFKILRVPWQEPHERVRG